MNPGPKATEVDSPSAIDSDRERELAELLTEISDRAARGELVDFQAICREHPELAPELTQLWGAVLVADAVGKDVSGQLHPSGELPTGVVPAAELKLPARLGDYELREEIGRGGMGIVYRAWQISLQREVAVKMLLRGSAASATDEARFRHEAESAARLQHAHIVPVFEVGEHDGHLFFSMRYIAGETLSQRMQRQPLEPREAARILALVARAVHYAHTQGVLHRDLKPSNILIDANGEPHVSDFGLARRVADTETLTRTGAILGTPAYMAPEQAAGRRGEVGPASDVYSMGAILYQVLTGRPPFQAASPMDTVFMLLEQEPVSPREINPSADRDLSLVALRCLQKPQDLRYESAEALACDLEAYLRDEAVSARSGNLAQVVARWMRETHHAPVLHNWGLLWMWHSLVLLVVCGLTDALYLSGNENRLHYFLLWTAGLGTWASVFWWLRQRMGPVTFVERQIAHIWAASMISIALLYPVEWLLGLKVLTLSPVLALSSGMVFLIKAGILSGAFYIQAVALFASAPLMAIYPRYAHFIFGVVSAASFFFPGLKYYRQRMREELRSNAVPQRPAAQ